MEEEFSSNLFTIRELTSNVYTFHTTDSILGKLVTSSRINIRSDKTGTLKVLNRILDSVSENNYRTSAYICDDDNDMTYILFIEHDLVAPIS